MCVQVMLETIIIFLYFICLLRLIFKQYLWHEVTHNFRHFSSYCSIYQIRRRISTVFVIIKFFREHSWHLCTFYPIRYIHLCQSRHPSYSTLLFALYWFHGDLLMTRIFIKKFLNNLHYDILSVDTMIRFVSSFISLYVILVYLDYF